MKSDKEIVGTLLGFDDYVSILLLKDGVHVRVVCECVLVCV